MANLQLGPAIADAKANQRLQRHLHFQISMHRDTIPLADTMSITIDDEMGYASLPNA